MGGGGGGRVRGGGGGGWVRGGGMGLGGFTRGSWVLGSRATLVTALLGVLVTLLIGTVPMNLQVEFRVWVAQNNPARVPRV